LTGGIVNLYIIHLIKNCANSHLVISNECVLS